ncbi:CARD PYD and [Takifugu flavidus]|uniref:CARD PYD and n=1 Tax=Takifugu flavidus TaxID=433684 RepID=A0A5C6PK75_9TELE|nr:CARD PYD and [Takifugu flavidus]
MAQKTIKMAIKDSLENLGKQNLKKFRSALLDRREKPRVPVSRVEDEDFLGITDVLVSTFGEFSAAQVTLDLLKQIKCNGEAEALESDLNASGLLKPKSNEHFVDKYRCALINRVSNIAPILDELLNEKVIDQEAYERIRALPTCQERIRELYCSGLKGGKACKDAFFKSLEKHERFLIDHLRTNQ